MDTLRIAQLHHAANMQGLGDVSDITRPRVVGTLPQVQVPQTPTWWQSLITAGTTIAGTALLTRNMNQYGYPQQYGYGYGAQMTPEQIAFMQQQQYGYGYNSMSSWLPIILVGGALLLLTRK